MKKPKPKTKPKPGRKTSVRTEVVTGLPPVRTIDLSTMLGMTGKTVAAWAAAGIVKRVGYGRFDLAASVRGFADHMREVAASKGKSNVSTARTALLEMQRRKGELAIDRELARLVDSDEMVASFEKDLVAIRSTLLSLPDRVSHRCGGLPNATVAAFKSEIADCLTDLAHGRGMDDPSPEDVARCMAIRERRGLVRDLGPVGH